MKAIKWIFRLVLKIFLWFFLISIGLTILYKFVPVPITPLMVIRLAEQASDSEKSMRLYKSWVPMDKISRHAPQAVYAAEDQKFMDHNGFDWEEMEKVWKANKEGKRVRGASTISQQTAKNVFLWPGRNLFRKGLEAYFTFLIELIWGKERIMTVYLNVIEMGEGIYGIEAAAQHNFNKSAEKLNRNEAALIAAVLPNPRRWTPSRPTPYILGRQAWILRQMNNLKQLEMGV
ncbi:monofunctional biosynthetic peptidoglycan transglycosylase [Arthrospiribacter ruber]|uniref:Biosynthetic peptidoglycan transglycosylase n=1 Tax=Arthrospiribacter ruber TaxID=2487934 RepID=A0A951IZL8_9BACT|nr:monofunctional biosynthetic peptidoglycan transglycosylase [Arthrospiribacter ruber]MBW3469297.1 monofunctional biosynthetic peptidoglycan transglycosylase [Arthrospiribacter ruber]